MPLMSHVTASSCHMSLQCLPCPLSAHSLFHLLPVLVSLFIYTYSRRFTGRLTRQHQLLPALFEHGV